MSNNIDKQSFEEFFTQYWERLYCYCYKMTSDNDLSQNIVQNIFTDLWERRNKIHIQDVDKYLFKSVKYQLFNHYRNGKINREILLDKFEEYIEENNESADHKLIDNLEKALNKLPEKRCRIVKMNKIHDMSIEEIATSLSISKQTVKNQLTVAVKQLRAGIF